MVVTVTVSNRTFRVRGTRIYIGIRLVVIPPRATGTAWASFRVPSFKTNLTNFFDRLLYTAHILWVLFHLYIMRHPLSNFRLFSSALLAAEAVLLSDFVGASPFGQKAPQKAFQLPTEYVHSKQHQPSHDDGQSSWSKAIDALKEASPQVLDTFTSVMSELGDAAPSLTWTLPQKDVLPRPNDDWDFIVSSKVLPGHSLRIKEPKKLGADNVKQVSLMRGVVS